MEQVHVKDAGASSVARANAAGDSLVAKGVYHVICRGADGVVKWEEDIDNLVTTVGKNDLLDKYLAGSAYTAAWYVGLVDGASTPSYNAADTSASHAGWTENTSYFNGTRVAPAFNAAAAGSKGTTATAFNVSGSATIAGCFMISDSVKAGSTGVLLSVGNFTGGSRAVISGDTLNVTYSLSV